jgi:hypothetical protein
MKYIKQFDNLSPDSNITKNSIKVEIGDYVICSEYDNDINFFIENNIGEVIDLNCGYPYIVKYNNAPEGLKNKNFHRRGMYKDEIKYVSKNKEDLESILLAKKFNI